MPKLHELQERRAACVTEMRAINDKAENEKRDYSGDEDKRHRELKAEVSGLATSARDTLALAERSDLGGMSFAFVPVDEHWDGDRRELQSVDLREISVVSAWPAYEATEVVARSRETRHPIASVARRFIESL